MAPAIGLLILMGLGFNLLAAVVATWPVMLALGILHTYVSQVPPLGLWTTLVLLTAFFFVMSAFKNSSTVNQS